MSQNPDLILAAPLWPHGDCSLMHLVRRAGQHSTFCWSQCVETGLSAVQYAILVVLAEESACDQQTLGQRAGFDKATGTYVIDRMSKSGLLNVVTDVNNRRRKLVSMTAEGEVMLNRMIEQAKSAEKMITAGLDSQDIADLKRLLSKLGGLQEPE
ncbi:MULTISPECIES: MarR family winged helix-turn-helix transcriptional regulator [unclassified Pantoea]|jgi:DNA-binding MarR family transcriptional regulator|uniref:MarR family winged helix-turn-helix transcriptional regulator n=1 Tax=unclassified Pantoea TaxID=2630326 RepID=UPI001CD77C1A|nr:MULTISPECIES: MarR family winged helix-turn-helix transcriptional regulator [unclassified Pantoea]MCA1177774.1 MarR family winged helix-turn-helix transcriptional regulator [Pantoea sp. alder69]MCA1252755.1 MarR family winged helix-turn-helix transcriptional regulator [Pantoea sp. alder70]MCA1266462.1 MarR family winged helix-turn-helix transcriptional regulator [Pantoea sp. alder81]